MSKRSRNTQVEEALRGARYGKQWFRLACPFCAEDGHIDRKLSLGVSASTGYYHCHRCATKGRLEDPPDPSAAERLVVPTERVIMPPPSEYRGLWTRAMSIEPAREYLTSRGLGDLALWHKYQIGAAGDGFWQGRIIIPMLSHEDGEWLGWIARLWRSPSPKAEGMNAMKYLYPKGMPRGQTFWNHRALFLETEDPVLVVEGVFDALPYGDDAVACLGKPSHAQQDWLEETSRPVVVVLDGDAWGESWGLAAKLRFNGQRAGFVRLPPKTDPNTTDPAWLLDAARKSLETPL